MSGTMASPSIAMWGPARSSASAAASIGCGPRAASSTRHRFVDGQRVRPASRNRAGALVTDEPDRHRGPPRVPFYNDPRMRALFYQLCLLVVVLWAGYEFAL